MAETGGRRLVVEVCSARNLMPKDGQGTASAYVMVDFEGQRRRSKTKFRDLNPQWDEKLEFMVHDPEAMASETLEINVYNDKKTGRRSTFLGKVKISGSTFVPAGSESLVYYPLEKRSVFSQIKGEIGLKVSFVDDAPPPPATEAAPAAEEKPAEEKKTEEPPVAEEKKPEDEEEKKAEEAKPDAKETEAPATPVKEEEKKPTEVAPATPVDAAKVEKPKSSPPTPASPAKDPSIGDLEIRPHTTERPASSSYDLVDRVPYLFVRVLKAKHSGDRSVFAKMVIGSHTVRTKAVKSTDWDQVFAFHKASLNSTALEVSVWAEEEKKDGDGGDTATIVEASLGAVSFDLQEIPKRSPPADSPLAPQWYTLEAGEGSPGADVMLAVWVGTQADEAFQEAWQSDSGGLIVHTRSKAYLSPKLWYLRLTVIQTQDLRLPPAPEAKARPAAAAGPDLYVKGQLGGQVFKTSKVSLFSTSSANPSWNEDLVFVAAEPFDPFLTISVEDATAGKEVGHARLPLSTVHRRVDDRAEPPPRWLNIAGDDDARPYAGRVHVRVCLEGGYHVLDEAAHVASDVRAASKHLSKPPVGLLEVGIRGAANLLPMKASVEGGSTDAYVVLKYGPKWARTRTIVDQYNPRWNEQYAWDVFDPCTVLTVAVFDNVRYKTPSARDARVGKVRIRVSTLDANRVYTGTYPLTGVYPSGAKKMGEIELSVRFTCRGGSWLSLLQAYGSPMLPRMHYVRPLGAAQQDALRQTAVRTVAARLARSEPPLGPEVVQHVLGTDAGGWSMRRSKANWFRMAGCLSGLAAAARWGREVRRWTHPPTTVMVHLLMAAAVAWPEAAVATGWLYVFMVVVWRYRGRPRGPEGMDVRLSQVEAVGGDEMDEEFDGFPSGRAAEVVRARYDRLRVVAGRAQAVLGDVAAQGERVEALLSWRDPRATGMFVVFCLVAAVVFYVVPFRAIALMVGFYQLRHPRFRDDMPAVPYNFFRRLPSLADRIL